MQHPGYKCVKCGNTDYNASEFRATGGRFAKVFDIQNRKYSTVTCTRCKYTEMYQADTSALGNIFDFFTN